MSNSKASPNTGQQKRRRDFDAMDWVRDGLEGKLPDGEYGLMLYLALRAEEDHTCYPGIRRMATAFNRNPRTIMRRLDNLESWGLITKRRRRNTSTKYTLNVGTLPGGDTGVTSQPDTSVTSGYDNGYNTSSAVEEQQFEEGDLEKANPTDLLLPPALDSDFSPEKQKKEKGAATVPVQSIARWQKADEIVAKYEKNVLAHPNSRIGLYFALGRHFYPAARKFKAGKALTSGQLKQLHGLFDTYGDRACQLLAMMFVEWRELIPKWCKEKTNPDFGMLDFDAMNKTLLARETPTAGIPPLKPIAKVDPPVQPKPLPTVPMTTGIEWMDEPSEEAA